MIRPDSVMENTNPTEVVEPLVRASTYFGLLAEFGTAHIPLHRVAEAYFGMSERQAKEKAAAKELPVPAFRVGSRKSPWCVSAADLAAHIDACRKSESDRWSASQGVSA